jgi:TolA-binding protein
VAGIISSKKHTKRGNIDFDTKPPQYPNIAELQGQIKQLQMEVDVLREALNLLKKDTGINITELKNREKAVVIDAMKDKYTLPELLKFMRKYSSYKGEISPEVDYLINRDFHAEKPNAKWLTDITEFAIQAGKIYLSPIIDCFDGMVVSWNTSYNTQLNIG